MLSLKTRKAQVQVTPETGLTILDHAMKSDVEWGFSCTRGTCARCRCYVAEGRELLSEPSDAEESRLEPEELVQGFRLACQCIVKHTGSIAVTHKPYF